MYIQIITIIVFILALATPIIKNMGSNYQNVIVKSVKVTNKNKEDIHVLNLYSSCLDFKTSKYKMHYLCAVFT